MSDTPDKIVSEDAVSDDMQADVEEACEWIVRLEKRDCDCRFYFIDRGGNVNARLSSALLMEKSVARQYAHAITEQHPVYKARAFKYETMRRKKEEAKKAETQKIEEQTSEKESDK